MSEYLTQSRPYAEAIFQISEQDDAIDSWIQDLTLISNALQDQAVKSLIETPDISQKEKTDKFIALFEGEISSKTSNFLKTLGEANRLRLYDNIFYKVSLNFYQFQLFLILTFLPLSRLAFETNSHLKL